MAKFTKLEANGERYDVFARLTVDQPWVQVESIRGEKFAQELVEELEDDDDKRAEYIADGKDMDWS